jgi:hypothetical protein
MQVSDPDWSTIEQQVARAAFDKAQHREMSTLMEAVRESASSINGPDDMWRLHDLLSTKRHEVDGKYDYRYPGLIFVFARLVKEGWLSIDDLDGLAPEKLGKVKVLSRM